MFALPVDQTGALVDNGGVPLEDYYSVTEAARLLGVSTDAIYTAIKKQLIAVRRHGGILFIHKDELERYRREKRNPGRPREKRRYQRRQD